MIRVALPATLRTLAGVDGELELEVAEPASIASTLDAIEAACPSLAGTIRDHATGKRRPFIRFYACGKDLSHEPPDVLLPEPVQSGRDPLLIVGAIAGG